MIERRRKKLLGLSFAVPVPWLVSIIVMGLVQFGVFYQQFKGFGDNLHEIKILAINHEAILNVQVQRNLEQDRRLDYQDRRIDDLEKRK